MTVLHILDSLEVGGAETLVTRLCRRQRDRGWQPSVHCLLRKGSLARELEAEDFEISLSGPGRLRRDLDVWRAMRRIRPDVVHCHNANATIHGAPIARFIGAKVVVATRHGLVPPEVARKREKRFWIAARFCDRVVAVCDAAARNLERGPMSVPEKIITIRNGTTPAPAGTETLPRKLGFTMVTVARLAREKDQGTLLRAAALARASLKDLQLWIVGDGPLRGELEALVRELQLDGCVLFAGERQDAGRWLQAADLFVLSSISEGLPVSVLEAMAAGLPLVLTSVGGMPELIELAHGGCTVKPSDPASLARAIVDVAADRARREEWGRNNQAAYHEQLTDTIMAENYLRLYGEQLSKSGHRNP